MKASEVSCQGSEFKRTKDRENKQDGSTAG